jgi:hypothetical protein
VALLIKKRKVKRKKKVKMEKKKNLLLSSKLFFCCKKFVKCNINMKKISPTPKSIIHKNPIKISPSSTNKIKPKENK